MRVLHYGHTFVQDVLSTKTFWSVHTRKEKVERKVQRKNVKQLKHQKHALGTRFCFGLEKKPSLLQESSGVCLNKPWSLREKKDKPYVLQTYPTECLDLTFALAFVVLSSKNIIIYNEEILIGLSFIAFLIFSSITLGKVFAKLLLSVKKRFKKSYKNYVRRERSLIARSFNRV